MNHQNLKQQKRKMTNEKNKQFSVLEVIGMTYTEYEEEIKQMDS